MAAHAHLLRGVRAFRTRASARAVQLEVDREMRQAYRPPAWVPARAAPRAVRDWDAWPAERRGRGRAAEPAEADVAAMDADAAEADIEAMDADAEASDAAEAVDADFAEADFAEADLTDADLTDADLADLTDAGAAAPPPLAPPLEALVDRLAEASPPPADPPVSFAPDFLIPPLDAAEAPTHAAALACWDIDAPPAPAWALDAPPRYDEPPLAAEPSAAALAAEPSAAALEALAAAPEADDVPAFWLDARGAEAVAAAPLAAVRAAAPAASERLAAPSRGVRDVYDWRTIAVSQRDVGMHGRPASRLLPAFDALAWVRARRWPTLSLLLRTAHAAVHRALAAVRGADAAGAGADAALAVAVRRYQQRWRTALAFEREHAEAELAALRARPVAELTALGVALDGLEAYWQTERHYGRRVAVFKRPGARRLPRHKLLPGAVVDVRPSGAPADWLVRPAAAPHRTLALVDRLAAPAAGAADARAEVGAGAAADAAASSPPPRIPYVSGELIDATPTQLRVRFAEAYEHLDLAGVPAWRVDRGTSRVVDERTDAALDALLYDADDVARASTPRRRYALVGTPLRAALVGAAAAPAEGLFARDQRIRSWYERYAAADPLVLDGDPALGLNASQTRAVALMLKEPLSLVQGPPGTGKTRTLVQAVALLKQHFAVPHPVLLAAHTNVAVDNVARACVARGLRVVRAGSAAAAHPALAPHTLEAHMARHAKHAELVEKQHALRALQRQRDALVEEARAAAAAGAAGAAPSPGAGAGGAPPRRLAELRRRIGRVVAQCHTLRSEIAADVLHRADVVCATAVAAGSRQLNAIDFPLVLVDEGSMATEPIALIALMRGCTHLAVLGDHQQLPPVLRSAEARRHGLSTSLFERLMLQGTPAAATPAARAAPRVPSVLLDEQFRMHPALAAFPNAAFYGGALRDAPSTHARAPLASAFAAHAPDGTPHAVTLLTHAPVAPSAAGAAGGLGGVSPYNAPQADLALALLCDLLERNPTLRGDEIGIVTPYEAQVRLLERMLAAGACAGAGDVARDAPGVAALPLLSEAALQTLAHLDAARAAQLADVEVHTVDGFEGREKRVMLFSTVKAGGGAWQGAPALRAALATPSAAHAAQLAEDGGAAHGGYVGFLADTRRLNVALTRAQSQLFILGNLDTLLSARLGRQGEAAVERSDVHAIRAYARWLLARGCVLETEAAYDRLLAQAAAHGAPAARS
ncbi:hypothetical protein CBS9595_004087 [Malassezia furfur]|nr:hypothetical protein CBS9595_004087 [Malassezia furfur]